MSKEEEERRRRQQYYRQPPQIDKNRQQMDRQLSQMQNRQSVHMDRNRQQMNRQPQQMGINRQSQQIGINRQPQQMGINRQPQQMGMNRQPQQMGINRQPQQMGVNRQFQQMGMNRQPQQMRAQQMEINRQPQQMRTNRQPTTSELHRQQTGRRTQRKQNQHRLRKIFVRTFLIVFFVLFLGAGGAFAAFKYYTKDMKRETIDETILEVNEEKQVQSVEMKIKNIAVFGVDSRNGEDTGNSDAIMIVSIDGNKGKIKMVSIARDTYVNLPKYGKTKITHAYSYGGPELAMATLNENFGMDITDYITVNFEQLAEIIEQMGGIDVELNEAERQELNKYVAPGVEKIQQTGAVHLNGEQAVSYSRIRKCDSDDMRTSRQRKVMLCLFEKAKELSPFQYPSYIKILMPMMETSMTDSEILQLAPVAMNKNLMLEQDSFPNDYIQTDGYKTKTEVEGVELWVYHYDLQEATNMLQKFIYDDIPFDQQ
ncbi:MAG: hypothetical protein HFE58_10390 [Firmicutes bacterium]|nr:hypothetical protein [Bacillota bacterium]